MDETIYKFENDISLEEPLSTSLGNKPLYAKSSTGNKFKEIVQNENTEMQITESSNLVYDAPKIIRVRKYRLYKGE